MIVLYTLILQKITEQFKKQIGFTATTYTSYDFYHSIMSAIYQSLQVKVTFYFHIA